MSQDRRFKFPNIQLLVVISLVFWLLIIQFSLGIEFATYDYLIGIICVIGILVAIITSKGE